VSEVLAVNDPHRIIGIIPELLPNKQWTVEVRTIEGPFTLTQVQAPQGPFSGAPARASVLPVRRASVAPVR
jgi:hypothetical protein